MGEPARLPSPGVNAGGDPVLGDAAVVALPRPPTAAERHDRTDPGHRAAAHACLRAEDLPRILPLIRAAHGWRQEDFARTAKLSPRTIRALEAGEVDPRCSTLEKVRRAIALLGAEVLHDAAGRLIVAVDDGHAP